MDKNRQYGTGRSQLHEIGTGRSPFPTGMKPHRKCHRLAPATYSTTEYAYYFTVCARHQGKPFSDPRLADAVINSLLWTKNHYRWLLFSYCLMPDHMHFVCRLTEQDVKQIHAGARGVQPEGVLDHLGRFKRFTTNQSWKYGMSGRLWQKSSYDRVLDMERPFVEIVEYVLNNPVRKGLVDDWQQWPYARIVDPWW